MTLGESARAAGYSLTVVESVDSTNRLALEMAADGHDRLWVVAKAQTAGRGRHGRLWVSPPGNLYATLVLVSPCPTAEAPKLGFVAGLSIADLLHDLHPEFGARLKWPNDLVVDGAKLTGILLEGRVLRDGRQAVAIGIGVNVASVPEVAGRSVVSLRHLGSQLESTQLFAALSDRMAYWLMVFAAGAGFENIRAAWSKLALPFGTAMSVKLPLAGHTGTFAGIDDSGRLKLDTRAGLVHVDAGDVFLNNETP